MSTLATAELFGPTIQGEGPSAGEIAMFIRLARCNLDCAWCDTAYTWDWSGKNGVVYSPAQEIHPMTVTAIYDWVRRSDVDLVIITGGEPLLQQRSLVPLVQTLARDRRVEIETNGTLAPLPEFARHVALFVVSPKLTNSGVDRRKAIRPGALGAFDDLGPKQAALKFVVRGVEDFAEVETLALYAPHLPVWVMPEGRSADEITTRLAGFSLAAIDHRWNVSTRLHVLAWGDERGR